MYCKPLPTEKRPDGFAAEAAVTSRHSTPVASAEDGRDQGARTMQTHEITPQGRYIDQRKTSLILLLIEEAEYVKVMFTTFTRLQERARS
jgi:hypothetical protein